MNDKTLPMCGLSHGGLVDKQFTIDDVRKLITASTQVVKLPIETIRSFLDSLRPWPYEPVWPEGYTPFVNCSEEQKAIPYLVGLVDGIPVVED